MIRPISLQLPGSFLSAVFLLASCSGVRTPPNEPVPLLNALFATLGRSDPHSFPETISGRESSRNPREAEITERLLAIAAHPHYRTPEETLAGTTGAEPVDGATVEEGESSPEPPPPIAIGDIFVTGPDSALDLRPALRLSTPVPEEGETAPADIPENLTRIESTRIPVTIAQEELARLREIAEPGRSLPTRSVALDFETRTHSLDSGRFHEWIADTMEEGDTPGEQAADWRSRWAAIRQRLWEGERMHLVVALTESDEIVASYPGAPAGRRDAEPIENAVATLFPQLEGIRAEARDGRIFLTRTPGIYWSVEVRELRLDKEGHPSIFGAGQPDLEFDPRHSGPATATVAGIGLP